MSVTLFTSHGEIKVELECELVPKTCKNFLALCASGYYDNTIFHRNIQNFIIQGGDPKGTGFGGESIYGRHFDDEIVQELKHDARGVLAMANSGANTNGSQFYFTYSKQKHLDGKNTVFGKIIKGIETLELMEREPGDKYDRPLNPIVLYKCTIHANPIAENES